MELDRISKQRYSFIFSYFTEIAEPVKLGDIIKIKVIIPQLRLKIELKVRDYPCCEFQKSRFDNFFFKLHSLKSLELKFKT